MLVTLKHTTHMHSKQSNLLLPTQPKHLLLPCTCTCPPPPPLPLPPAPALTLTLCTCLGWLPVLPQARPSAAALCAGQEGGGPQALAHRVWVLEPGGWVGGWVGATGGADLKHWLTVYGYWNQVGGWVGATGGADLTLAHRVWVLEPGGWVGGCHRGGGPHTGSPCMGTGTRWVGGWVPQGGRTSSTGSGGHVCLWLRRRPSPLVLAGLSS